MLLAGSINTSRCPLTAAMCLKPDIHGLSEVVCLAHVPNKLIARVPLVHSNHDSDDLVQHHTHLAVVWNKRVYTEVSNPVRAVHSRVGNQSTCSTVHCHSATFTEDKNHTPHKPANITCFNGNGPVIMYPPQPGYKQRRLAVSSPGRLLHQCGRCALHERRQQRRRAHAGRKSMHGVGRNCSYQGEQYCG